MIKSALFKVCSIVCYTFFTFFEQFMNTMPVKIFCIYCKPFTESFFYIFACTKALLSKCMTIEANTW